MAVRQRLPRQHPPSAAPFTLGESHRRIGGRVRVQRSPRHASAGRQLNRPDCCYCDEVPEAEHAKLNWRPIVTLALCAIGVGLSTYTLWVHYHPKALVCLSAGPIDCQAVLTSAQSVVLGVPVPVFGLVFFVGMGALCLPASWSTAAAWVHWLRLIGVVIGIATVVYLVSTELFTVKKICLWCTGVHVVTFALFIVVVTSTPRLLDRSRDHTSWGT
jgi:uncharacterized membrane protein